LLKKNHSNGEVFNINHFTEHTTVEMIFFSSFDIDIRQYKEGKDVEKGIFTFLTL